MYQCTKSHSQERYHNQVIVNSLHVLLPGAICCCLRKCGFDIRVVLCTSVDTKSHSQER